MSVHPEHQEARDLEHLRDSLVQKLLNCEAEFNKEGAMSRQEYLETRHALEQRLIQVMDNLMRLQQRG